MACDRVNITFLTGRVIEILDWLRILAFQEKPCSLFVSFNISRRIARRVGSVSGTSGHHTSLVSSSFCGRESHSFREPLEIPTNLLRPVVGVYWQLQILHLGCALPPFPMPYKCMLWRAVQQGFYACHCIWQFSPSCRGLRLLNDGIWSLTVTRIYARGRLFQRTLLEFV